MAHDNVTFNTNGTLSTNPKHPLVWQEHMSAGNREDDILILPNIALLVSAIFSLRRASSSAVAIAEEDYAMIKNARPRDA